MKIREFFANLISVQISGNIVQTGDEFRWLGLYTLFKVFTITLAFVNLYIYQATGSNWVIVLIFAIDFFQRFLNNLWGICRRTH